VILWWLFLNPIRQHILAKRFDRHFLRRNDTNLNTWKLRFYRISDNKYRLKYNVTQQNNSVLFFHKNYKT
jgi:hypothetical protein